MTRFMIKTLSSRFIPKMLCPACGAQKEEKPILKGGKREKVTKTDTKKKKR